MKRPLEQKKTTLKQRNRRRVKIAAGSVTRKQTPYLFQKKEHSGMNHYKPQHYNALPNTVLPTPLVSSQVMSCAPSTIGRRINKNSCYTSSILHKIKDYYNKTHRTNPIKPAQSKTPDKLWQELKTRLTQCKNKPEDCWLETIHDKKLRKEIDDMIFAPDAPPEWTKNPNEWLSNWDISNVLKQYEMAFSNFKYIEPSPIDFDAKPKNLNGSCVAKILCEFSLENYIKKGKTKIGFVFNLDKHTQSGSHWVSMFLDLEDKYIFYFDSTGHDIPEEIAVLKDRIIKQAKDQGIILDFYKNHLVQHQHGGTECGIYSLFFIITLLTFPSKTETKLPADAATTELPKIKLFLTDDAIPDKWVQNYRTYFFNIPRQPLARHTI
jgi:hypothetical protein